MRTIRCGLLAAFVALAGATPIAADDHRHREHTATAAIAGALAGAALAGAIARHSQHHRYRERDYYDPYRWACPR